MNRFTLNLLAGVIVLVSSWTLAVPQAARAQDPPSVACCTGGGGRVLRRSVQVYRELVRGLHRLLELPVLLAATRSNRIGGGAGGCRRSLPRHPQTHPASKPLINQACRRLDPMFTLRHALLALGRPIRLWLLLHHAGKPAGHSPRAAARPGNGSSFPSIGPSGGSRLGSSFQSGCSAFMDERHGRGFQRDVYLADGLTKGVIVRDGRMIGAV